MTAPADLRPLLEGRPQRDGRHGGRRGAPVVDVVVPVYNEERDLEPSVRRLRAFLDAEFPFETRVTIADNASTDATWSVATRLSAELTGVTAVRLPLKGRGRALKETWLGSDAEVVAYMDVDLSTDLRALLPLVAPLLSGHSELAIGSRLANGSRVIRGPKREFISRMYNLILRTALRTRFSDAQCGFKAMRADIARRLLPLVDDAAWFFDTEMLVVAERSGLRIHEVPVDWVDDPDSRVDIAATAAADLRGVARLLRDRRRLSKGSRDGGDTPRDGHAGTGVAEGSSAAPGTTTFDQVLRFGAIGVVSTLAYVGLYALLSLSLPAVASNALALVVTALGNTAANRRITFGIRGPDRLARDQLAGLVAFGIALAITTSAIELLHWLVPAAPRGLELAVLVTANALATLVRFVVLRRSIDRSRPVALAPISARSQP